MKASDLYEECEKYPEAVEVLIESDAKLYLEAAAKAKRFEDNDPHTSFEFSSSSIAKTYILKYCKPPEKISESEDKIFNGLLPYIKDSEYQILLLKHAKRFSEAIDRLRHSHNYIQFYRLAFAQGSNVVLKKSPAPNAFSDSYYDLALQLSLMQGLDDIHNALVIHSGRAYFSIQKPYIVLKLTQLENLLRTCGDSLIQINAALLLARFDSSKIKEAVEICRKYKCLPGEVELITYYLCNKSLPGINCSFHDQLEISNKIQYLLSLERDVLLAQYKGILGLHEGKDDEFYLKQEDYPVKLRCSFETGCYLLSHESQDIWLQQPHRLSQGKRILRDIDGMLILSPDILAHKITGHLKSRLKLVEKSLAAHISQSPLYKYHFSQRKYCFSSAQFDTEAAHFHLEFCMSVLLRKLEFNKSTAMELLRCYHSIETSHYFPICENYSSNIDIIRGGAWRTLQSLTTVWMKKCINTRDRDKFDFLKLWEQSAITKLLPILRENLEYHKESTRDVQKVALQKATISWLDICQNILSNPLSTCRSFFFECVPQLIKLKQNLSSIIDAMSIHGTITLMLISSLSSTSTVIPQMYDRALSVYENLISKRRERNIISSVCYNLKFATKERSSTRLLKNATKVLQQALNQLIFCLTRKVINRPGHLRDYLILILTLLVNAIMLQPTPLAISKFHLQLNKGLERILKRKWKFQFDYEKVYISIQQASSTSDFLKIIEYLLCPNGSSGRYEALMTIVRGRRGFEMNILSDKDVLALPPITITGFERIPRVLHIPELVSTSLVPESERREKLYFQFHYKFQDVKYSTKIASATCQPPWMKLPESPDSELTQPPITGAGSLCHICKVEFQSKDEHMKSGSHAKNLAFYRQFSMLHDTKYTHCDSKLRQFLPRLSKKAKKVIEHILDNNDRMIQSIYEEGQWESGIDLLLTCCIPNIENILESLNHFPAVNLIIVARKCTQTTASSQ